MRPAFWLAVMGMTMAGCGEPLSNEEEAASGEVPAASSPVPVGVETQARGLKLYMHEYTPSGRTARKPVFVIEAATGRQTGEGGIWLLEDALATIFRDDEERLWLEAGEAEVNQGEDEAHLGGGVRVQAGEVTLEMETIRWDNGQRVAWTDDPVTLRKGDTFMTAESVVIDPDAETIVCQNGEGRFDLRERAL